MICNEIARKRMVSKNNTVIIGNKLSQYGNFLEIIFSSSFNMLPVFLEKCN